MEFDPMMTAILVIGSLALGAIVISIYLEFFLKSRAARGQVIYYPNGKGPEVVFAGKNGAHFRDGRVKEMIKIEDIEGVKELTTMDGTVIGPITFENIHVGKNNWIPLIGGEGIVPINIDASNRPCEWLSTPDIEAQIKMENIRREQLREEIKEEMMSDTRRKEVEKGDKPSIYDEEEVARWPKR